MTTLEPRRTRQRELITAYLESDPHFHTAQQVHDRLRERGETVSLPTVYRTLAGLAEAGELDVLTENGQAAYRHCSPEHHHHLVCRGCGRTIELADSPVEQWVAAVAQRYGFTAVHHLTEITGLCLDCQSQA